MTDKPEPELKELPAPPQLVVSPELQSGIASPSTEDTSARKRFGLPEPGDVFAGRYKILAKLGSGGMSVVYQVRDQVLKKEVAVKLLLPRGNKMDQANLRFQQEATTIAKLDHANIVKVLDLSVSPEEIPYIVMELLPGKSLADILMTESLHPARVIEIMLQACDALSHAHAHGIVHRDVKPSNFMLQDVHGDVKLKLLDFGVAKLLAPDAESPKLTQTGETMGSPLYMSPEQCTGDKIDERSDIYSLGCVMYEALSGSPPFISDTPFKVILKHMNDQPLPIKLARMNQADVNSINAVVMKCLQKDPGERYATLAAIKQDLQKLLRGDAVEYTYRMARLDEVVPSASAPPELIQLPVLNQSLRIYGFTEWQYIVLAIAVLVSFTVARSMPLVHGAIVPIGFLAFISIMSVVLVVIKALELHSAFWWLNRFGVPVNLPPVTLPDVLLLSNTGKDASAAKQSPIYWRLSNENLAAASAARKRQLTMLMANLLPELNHIQFFYSNFSSLSAGSSHSDCYIISQATASDLAGQVRKDDASAKLRERFQNDGLPLSPVPTNELRSLLFPLLNPAHNQTGSLLEPDHRPDSKDLCLTQPEQTTNYIKLDGQFCANLAVTNLPPAISSAWYKNLLDLPCRLALSVHSTPCDAQQASSARLAQQIRRAYELQLRLPTTQYIETNGVSFVDVGIYVSVFADSAQQLAQDISLIMRAVANFGGGVALAELKQIDCFVSAMPFAEDRRKTVHRLPATAAAALFPFV